VFKNRLILCPTDFSPAAAAAFAAACELARVHGAKIEVLHVAAPVVSFGDVVASQLPGFRDDLREQLRGVRSADPGVLVTTALLEGDPAEMIVDVARTSGCDLIVMGTHGRSGVGRLVLGSVAEQVLRKAPCPVLTMKSDTAVPQAAVAEALVIAS
jgi:nucleotide-binding universal stress UspA family protein